MPGHPALPDDTLRVVEVHYFRVPRYRWELMLLRARQSGANAISSYIPWVHHQPSPDPVDLTGATAPDRDLVGFVELCARCGLGFIAKPGPFCDSEMLGGGVPTWLIEAHPDWWAVRHDGEPYRHGDSDDPRLSYDDPGAQQAARQWLVSVARALEPFVGSTLWAVQVDNETPGDGMWIHEDGRAPSPIRADLASTGRWQAFLHGRYGDVADLNTAWHTDHRSFDEVDVPRVWDAPTSVAGLRRWVDLDRFADAQLASGLGAYADALRSVLGDRVPLFHDWLCMPWQLSGMLVDPGVLADTCGWVGQNVYAEGVDPDDMIAGTAWYRMNDAEYIHHAWWRTRLCHTLSPPGMPHLVPEVSARQAFYLQCSLVGGMDAPCIYMLHSSEPEPAGVGAFQRWAEEAPVLPDGNVFEWWWNLRCLFVCLQAGGAELAGSPLEARVAIAWDHAGERVARWAGVIAGAGFDDNAPLATVAGGANTAALGQDLARRLVDAGVCFDVVDASRASLERYGRVVVPPTTVLSRAAAGALIAAGRRVEWIDAIPTLDEDLQPLGSIDGFDALTPTSMDATIASLDATAAGGDRLEATPAGIDTSVRTGATGRRFVTVVNRCGQRFDGEVAGTPVATNHASVTWFALGAGRHHDRVEAALLHGDDAAVGDVTCSQGQCAVALLPVDASGSAAGGAAPEAWVAPDATDPRVAAGTHAWHIISQERCTVVLPGAAGAPLWRVTLSGKVVDAGRVGDNGHLRVVARDDRGDTDRYVAGSRHAADGIAAMAADYFMATAEAAAAEAAAIGVDPAHVAHLLRRTRSRLAAGSATDHELRLLADLERISARTNDLRLGES
jgi:hypothetical protein